MGNVKTRMDCVARIFDGYVQQLDDVPDEPSICDALRVLSRGKVALHKPSVSLSAPEHAPHKWIAEAPIDRSLLKHIFLRMATSVPTLAELHVYHKTACAQIRLKIDESTPPLVFDTSEVAAIVRLCADANVHTIVLCSDPDGGALTNGAVEDIRSREGDEEGTLGRLGKAVAHLAITTSFGLNADVSRDDTFSQILAQIPKLKERNGNPIRSLFLELYYPARPKLQISEDALDAFEKSMIDTHIPRARARGFMRMTAGDAVVNPAYERINVELFYPNHASTVPPTPRTGCPVDHVDDDADAPTAVRVMRAMATAMHELDGDQSDVRKCIATHQYIDTERFMGAWQRSATGMERMLLCEALLILRIMYSTADDSPFVVIKGHAKIAHRLLLFGLMHCCFATRCVCDFLRAHTDATYNTMTHMYANAPRMLEQLFAVHDLKGRVIPAAYQSGYMNGSWQRYVRYDMEKLASVIHSHDDEAVFRYYEDRPVWCWNTDSDEGGFDMYDVHTNKKLMYDKLTERRSFVRSGVDAVKNVAAVQSITLMVLKVVMPVVARVSSILGVDLNVDSATMYENIFQSTSIASNTDVRNMRNGVWPVDVLFHIAHGIVFALVRGFNARHPLGRAAYPLIFLKNIPKRVLLTDIMCGLESAGALPTLMHVGMERSVIDPIAATALKWLVVSQLGQGAWVNIWRNSRVLITKARKSMLYFSTNELKVVVNVAMHSLMHALSGDDESRQSIARLVALLNPVDMVMEKTMRMVLLWTWIYSMVTMGLRSEMKRLGFV